MGRELPAWIVDADSHITELPDLWTSRVASKWGNLVPHVAWDAENNEEAWYENINETIEASLGGQLEEIRRRILFENAAELYKIKFNSQCLERSAAT